MKAKRLGVLSAATATTGFALIFYTPMLHRGLGYDEALSIGNFIATPSILDPFRRQIGYNNHVLFSFLEHLNYRASGGWSAVSMRLVPLVFALLSIALLSAVLAYRLGFPAGVFAGLVLAANPAFAFAATTSRGYTLLVFASMAATILLLELLRSTEESPKGWQSIAYVVAVAAGLATHLFMVLVVLGHVTLVASRRRLSRRWRSRWILGLGFGSLAYGGILHQVVTGVGGGRFFWSSLPSQLPGFFLGRPRAAAILIGVVVAAGVLRYLARVETKALFLVYITSFLLLWLVLQPQFLYVRFFLWAIPAVACAVAVAVSRRPALALLVAAAVALELVVQIPHRHDNQAPVRLAGQIVTAAGTAGQSVCADTETGYALIAETTSFQTIRRVDQLNGCDLIVLLLPRARTPVIAAARAMYPFSYELPAVVPGLALSRSPLACRTRRKGDRLVVVDC